MINLTVSEAHTYYVGTQEALVHNSGPCFGLKVAFEGALEAADYLDKYVKVKHLSSIKGRHRRFKASTLEEQNKLIDEALKSSSATFTSNGTSDRSFTVTVDMGRAIGTKGERFMQVIIGYPEKGGIGKYGQHFQSRSKGQYWGNQMV